MKLALCMIVKNEVELLRGIFEKYRNLFDEAVIVITNEEKRKELEALCDEFKCSHYYFDWINDFSAARNFAASKVTADYYFRMDCDDTLKNEDKIRESAEKALRDEVNVVYANYEYGTDEWGNLNATHYRETIVRRTDELIWQKSVHETIVPLNPATHRIYLDETFSTVHHKTLEQSKEAQIRNFDYLVKEYNKYKDDCDPRTIAYLGRTFFTCGDLDKAIFFLQKHIEKSGWDEDRYMSWCMLSDIFRIRKDYKRAVASAFEAIQECENYPDAYLRLHDAYFDQDNWQKAIYWGEYGIKQKTPKSFMLVDPSSYTWRPALSLSYSYFQMGDFEKAKSLLDYVEKFVPTLDFVKENKKVYAQGVEHKKFVEHYFWLAHFIKDKEPKLLQNLLNCIPSELNENELLVKFRQANTPPKKWADNTVVIYCGQAWETWADPSVLTGIGGSEEAVIYLSRELAKLGYLVTVFNSCGDLEGTYNGVSYKNYVYFNPNDEYANIIAWRNNIFQYGIKGKSRIVWLHDVVPAKMFTTKEEIESFDKLVVLSEYHKSIIPEAFPREKIYVSRNGVNLPDFESKGMIRNPHRMIYTSSYDRGLIHLLEMWKDIKAEVPDAELHCFYGWQTYDKMVKMGAIKNDSFKQFIIPLMAQEGINDHGRVGHKQLIKEFQKSGLYAYPCHFAEISCISAMKAQVSGAMPVVTNHAALAETVKLGIKVDGLAGEKEVDEKYKQAIILALKDNKLQEDFREQIKEHVPNFGWDSIASEWARDIFVKSEAKVEQGVTWS